MALYLERLEGMLAELVDLPNSEAYHRKRADLYASVLVSLTVENHKLTRHRMYEVARLALTAEGMNPEHKTLAATLEPRTSRDNPNDPETRLP